MAEMKQIHIEPHKSFWELSEEYKKLESQLGDLEQGSVLLVKARELLSEIHNAGRWTEDLNERKYFEGYIKRLRFFIFNAGEDYPEIASLADFDSSVEKELKGDTHKLGAPPTTFRKVEFINRKEELGKLLRWILYEKNRLVIITGIGGVGKTELTIELKRRLEREFDFIVERSVRSGPFFQDLLRGILLELEQPTEKSQGSELVDELVSVFHKKKCLLFLDNLETIVQMSETKEGDFGLTYRDSYATYERLIDSVGEQEHNSCLVLTSRELPDNIASLEREGKAKILPLSGLSVEFGRKILESHNLSSSEGNLERISMSYQGNPLALKLVAASINNHFSGQVDAFYKQQDLAFGDYFYELEKQFNRLSKVEQDVLFWIALHQQEEVLISEIKILIRDAHRELVHPTVETLEDKRGLLRRTYNGVTISRVTEEFIIDRLIQQIRAEISSGNVSLLDKYPLVMVSLREHIMKLQRKQIVEPLIDALLSDVSGSIVDLESRLQKVLDNLSPDTHEAQLGYLSGNVLNILHQLKLSDYVPISYEFRGVRNFSGSVVKHADLRKFPLHNFNFENTRFESSVLFTEVVGNVLSFVFHPNGRDFVTGHTSGEVALWNVETGFKQKGIFVDDKDASAHGTWVWSLTLSSDGKKLASGSVSGEIKVWDFDTRKCLHRIKEGEKNWLRSLKFSHNGELIAGGGDDGTIRVWKVSDASQVGTLQDHTHKVRAIVFTNDDQGLISASSDKTIKVWGLQDMALKKTLTGHEARVRTISLNAKGNMLASGSDDKTVRVWDLNSGECISVLSGHTNWVRSVVFLKEDLLASGSEDQTIKFWDANTYKELRIELSYSERYFSGSNFNSNMHTDRIRSVVSCNSPTIIGDREGAFVSISDDQTIKFWGFTAAGENISINEFRSLIAQSNWVRSVSISKNNKYLASTDGNTVNFWDLETGKYKILSIDRSWIQSVALSPDASQLVISSADRSVEVYDTKSSDLISKYEKHEDWVWAVVFNSDGTRIASGSDDNSVKVWDTQTRNEEPLNFEAHTSWIWTLAFSNKTGLVASGSNDCSVKVWDVESGKQILQNSELGQDAHKHRNWVLSVAFSHDDRFLASASNDGTIKIWDVNDGKCICSLSGYIESIFAVSFSSTQLLACGSDDHDAPMLKIWNIDNILDPTSECNPKFMIPLAQNSESTWIRTARFNHDGSSLVLGGEKERIDIWDLGSRTIQSFNAKKLYQDMVITYPTCNLTELQLRSLKSLGSSVKTIS